MNELHSLGPTWPPGAPFSGVQSFTYWSSTSFTDVPTAAWRVDLTNGTLAIGGKTSTNYVWPVRGGKQ